MKTILCLLAMVALVAAECPNACSGHGTCGPKDYCSCYKNFLGNDCSLRLCQFGHAHVDSPKGDLDGSGGALGGATTTVVTSDEVYPYGTTEQYPNAGDNEGHFYMECSNKGICNRKAGDCECFDGYEGTACQRASCPDACSGHGTCESIAELAALGPNGLSTTASGASTYTLWDADYGMGCQCDAEWFGSNCGQRKCKYGVDPLYLSEGTAVVENTILMFDAAADLGGTYRLEFFDVFGESWVTAEIAVATETCLAAKNALDNVPNGVINTVTCDVDASYGTNGYALEFSFDANPGVLLSMEIFDSSSLTGTSPTAVIAPQHHGEFTDRYATKGADVTVSAIANGATAVTTVETSSGATVAVAPDASYTLLKIGDQHVLANAAGTNSITLEYNFIGTTITGGSDYLFKSTDTVATVGTTSGVYAWTTGATSFDTYNAGSLVRGSYVYVQDQLFEVRSISAASDSTVNVCATCVTDLATDALTTNADAILEANQYVYINTCKMQTTADSATGNTAITATTAHGCDDFTGQTHAMTYAKYTITVDRPFGGKRDGAQGSIAAVENLFQVTMVSGGTFEYVSQCSNRGTCDNDMGTCQCFTGYSDDNCDTQNALAA